MYGCSSTNREKPSQVYFSDNGDTISIYSDGSNDIIFIKGHGGEGWCSITNEPHPYIHDILKDTIVIRYDYMHDTCDPDTVITGYLKQLDIGQNKYTIKVELNYLYNGNAIGSIEGIAWEDNYSYLVDSIVHWKDTVYFFKETDVLYRANQRNVICNYQKGYWEVFYANNVLRDGRVYKMKNSIRFIQR